MSEEDYKVRERARRKRHEVGMMATLIAAGIASTKTDTPGAIASRAFSLADALWEEVEAKLPLEDR